MIPTARRLVQPVSCVAVACTVAAIASFLFYPYIRAPDGQLRWDLAVRLVEGGDYPLRRLFLVSEFPALMQAAGLWAFGSMGAFHYLQAAFFNLAIFGACGALTVDRREFLPRFAVGAAIVVSPLSVVLSMVVIDSVWTFIGMVAAGLVLFARSETAAGQGWRLIALAIALTVLLGSRVNALAAVPIVILVVLMQPRAWILRFADTAALAVALLGAFVLPGIVFDLPRYSPVALGLAWEVVGTAKAVGPNLADVLDRFGSTGEAMAMYSPRYLNGLFYGEGAPLPVANVVDPGAARQIVAMFFDVVWNHPVEYLRVKLDLWRGVLGLEPLLQMSHGLGEASAPWMPRGVQASPEGVLVYSAFQTFGNGYWSLARLPWVLMGAGTSFAIVRLVGNRRIDLDGFLLLVAVAYYGSFLAAAQAMEFRYFLPAYFILVCVLGSAGAASAWLWICRRRTGTTSRFA